MCFFILSINVIINYQHTTGGSIMTVKEYELIAQAKKQLISLEICPFYHCIGTFLYLVSKKFHDHPVVIHLERLCKTILTFRIHGFSMYILIFTVSHLKSISRGIITGWSWNCLETRYQNLPM